MRNVPGLLFVFPTTAVLLLESFRQRNQGPRAAPLWSLQHFLSPAEHNSPSWAQLSSDRRWLKKDGDNHMQRGSCFFFSYHHKWLLEAKGGKTSLQSTSTNTKSKHGDALFPAMTGWCCRWAESSSASEGHTWHGWRWGGGRWPDQTSWQMA